MPQFLDKLGFANKILQRAFSHQRLRDTPGQPTAVITLFYTNITSRSWLTSSLTDNVGLNPHLISASTIENVVAAFPRKQWSSCFAAAMTVEMDLKPWCHTTANEGFVEAVLANELMAPYDG